MTNTSAEAPAPDLVERLNKAKRDEQCNDSLCFEAADEIARLTAEVERLQSELADALTDLSTARQDNASFGPEFKRLTAEVERLKTSGIAEVAAHNPSVMDWIKHWEDRTLKADAEVERLRGAPHMITPEQIPDEVATAAHDVFWGAKFDGKPIDLEVEFDRLFHYAVASSLSAWPGAFEQNYRDDKSVALILPLPKEGE